MEYEVWRSPTGKFPVTEAIENLRNGAERFSEKLLRLEQFTYPQLCRSETLKRVKGAKFKLHELRLDFNRNTYRIFCVPAKEKLYLLHMVTKKYRRLLQKDIAIAEERARMLSININNL